MKKNLIFVFTVLSLLALSVNVFADVMVPDSMLPEGTIPMPRETKLNIVLDYISRSLPVILIILVVIILIVFVAKTGSKHNQMSSQEPVYGAKPSNIEINENKEELSNEKNDEENNNNINS